jgi:hypothetical protein
VLDFGRTIYPEKISSLSTCKLEKRVAATPSSQSNPRPSGRSCLQLTAKRISPYDSYWTCPPNKTGRPKRRKSGDNRHRLQRHFHTMLD